MTANFMTPLHLTCVNDISVIPGAQFLVYNVTSVLPDV